MNDPVFVGLGSSATYLVTDDMSPPHLPNKVLSTPDMIRLIEVTCQLSVQEHLDEGQTTVGIHVCVSHAASVASGEEVEVAFEVTEIDRKLVLAERTASMLDDDWGSALAFEADPGDPDYAPNASVGTG